MSQQILLSLITKTQFILNIQCTQPSEFIDSVLAKYFHHYEQLYHFFYALLQKAGFPTQRVSPLHNKEINLDIKNAKNLCHVTFRDM